MTTFDFLNSYIPSDWPHTYSRNELGRLWSYHSEDVSVVCYDDRVEIWKNRHTTRTATAYLADPEFVKKVLEAAGLWHI